MKVGFHLLVTTLTKAVTFSRKFSDKSYLLFYLINKL